MSQRKASATGAAKPPRKKIRWKRMLPFYLMALPGFIYMIINNYLPMFGIVIAFKKLNFKKGIWGSPWCGFDNFKFLFASADAWIITRNTIFYNIAFFLVGNVTAIAVAILINEIRKKTAKKLYQSLILLPYLMSWVIVSCRRKRACSIKVFWNLWGMRESTGIRRKNTGPLFWYSSMSGRVLATV